MRRFGGMITTGGGSGTAGNLKIGPDYGGTGQHAMAVAMSMPASVFGFARTVTVTPTMPAVILPFTARTISLSLAGSYLGAPNWLSVGTVDSSTADNDIVIPKPSGLAVGDLMLAFVGFESLEVLTLPSGFTQILNTQRASLTPCTLNSSWKIATSADVAASNFTFTLPTNNAFFGCIHRISATHATTPINVSAGANASAADPVAPTATTTAANCLIFVACSQRSAVGITYTPPSGYTERTDQNGNGAAGAHLLDGTTATTVLAVAGATGAQTMDSSAVIASDYASQTIAIAPGSLTL